MLEFSKLVLNTEKPVHIQISYFIKQQIHIGEAKKGDMLPSRREVATKLKINPNTAQKAFRMLEEEGLIVTPQNASSMLAYDDTILASIHKEMTCDFIGEFVKIAKINQFQLEEVVAYIEEEWRK